MSWICAFWSGHVGSAAGCRRRVLLRLEWCVRSGAGLLAPLQGAAASCCCLSAVWVEWPAGAAAKCRCRVRVPVPGTNYCQGAVCILGTWVLLQGTAVTVRWALWNLGAGVAAGGCEMSMTIVGLLGFNENYVYAVAKKASAGCNQKYLLFFGLCRRNCNVFERLTVEWLFVEAFDKMHEGVGSFPFLSFAGCFQQWTWEHLRDHCPAW